MSKLDLSMFVNRNFSICISNDRILNNTVMSWRHCYHPLRSKYNLQRENYIQAISIYTKFKNSYFTVVSFKPIFTHNEVQTKLFSSSLRHLELLVRLAELTKPVGKQLVIILNLIKYQTLFYCQRPCILPSNEVF